MKRFQKRVSIALAVILVFSSIPGCVEQTPPLTVTGCILSEDGGAIPEAKVAYLQYETFTDEEGCFSLEDVSPGTGDLSLSKEGCVTMTTIVTVTDSVDVGTVVLPEKYGDIAVVEGAAKYEPGVAAEDMIHYYSTMGFDELGTIKAEYAAEPIYITVLKSSTRPSRSVTTKSRTSTIKSRTSMMK